MKVYQIMVTDGYYPDSLFNEHVYSSRESCRKVFEDNKKDSDKLYENYDENCTYYIQERDLVGT